MCMASPEFPLLSDAQHGQEYYCHNIQYLIMCVSKVFSVETSIFLSHVGARIIYFLYMTASLHRCTTER